MTLIDHYQLSKILGSQIVGSVPVLHGQLSAHLMLNAVKSLSYRDFPEEAEDDDEQAIDTDAVIRVFIEVREKRGDRGSADLYIADKVRNDELVRAWREHGVGGSVRLLNRCLMNARKQSKLKGLASVKFMIDPAVKEHIQFACEFSACELRYERGASIDDILCCPVLSEEFHKRCQRAVPDASWLECRWTILSLRKAGRHSPSNEATIELDNDPVSLHGMIEPKKISLQATEIPHSTGVFALVDGQKELYITGAKDLRNSIEYLSQPQFQKLAHTALWRPSANLFFSFAEVDKASVAKTETWLIATKRPLFNVPRTASTS